VLGIHADRLRSRVQLVPIEPRAMIVLEYAGEEIDEEGELGEVLTGRRLLEYNMSKFCPGAEKLDFYLQLLKQRREADDNVPNLSAAQRACWGCYSGRAPSSLALCAGMLGLQVACTRPFHPPRAPDAARGAAVGRSEGSGKGFASRAALVLADVQVSPPLPTGPPTASSTVASSPPWPSRGRVTHKSDFTRVTLHRPPHRAPSARMRRRRARRRGGRSRRPSCLTRSAGRARCASPTSTGGAGG